jgi:hypothetical protein
VQVYWWALLEIILHMISLLDEAPYGSVNFKQMIVANVLPFVVMVGTQSALGHSQSDVFF